MKTKLLMLLGLLFLGTITMAQTTATTFRIKGQLLDSLTQEGEPYATIKITRASTPDKAVKMLVTDMKGKFQEKVPGTGNFVMTITSVGRTPIVKPFVVKAGEKEVDFGILYITDASNELGQVEVVAQKPLVKADIDKIEYNVQDDPDAKTNSVLEMLRKVPLVTVDGEDNIKVNGSSSFKVFVNGKPNNMMSNNPTEVLKSMPANSIKNIEVITNPGPKYDAEGVGGILNIITVGSGMEGYTVTLSGNASNTGVGGGMFGTVQSGKLTVSARYNYNYNDSPRSRMGGSRNTLGELNANSSDLEYEGSSKSESNFQSGSMEASYEIDTLRLISMSFGLWGGGYNSNSQTGYRAFSPVDASPFYSYQTMGRSKNSWYSIDGGFDYQRSSSTVKGRLLTFSYKINTRPQTSDSYSTYEDVEYVPDWQHFVERLNEQHNDGAQNTAEHTFQVDYTTPIGKMHTIESGVKYINRNNKAENDRYDRILQSNDDYVLNENYTSHYKHRNDILAAYAGYGLRVKKLSMKLGVRYEHTLQDVEYKKGRGEDFTKNLDDVVPSASLGWKLTDLSNLRFGYNLRILRPGIYELNPYLDDSNPTSVSRGNPDLETEKNHRFTLSYSNFTQKFNINMTFACSFTNNSIERVSYLMSDTEIPGISNPSNKEVIFTTYENAGKSRTTNLSTYINWNASKNTRVYTNMFVNYSHLEGPNGMKNGGWNCYGVFGLQQTLPKDWRVSCNFFGQTPWISLQGKGTPSYSYSIGVNKAFLKKRLNLSAFASNFFSNHRRYENKMKDASFRSNSWSRYESMYYGMSVSYRFGELKASVKKARRTINNDDVKQASNNAGGSGGN